MKILEFKRLTAVLILIAGLLVLSGCSPCEEGGGQQLSPVWTAMQFPVVEGGEICACGQADNGEDYVRIAHKADNPFDLVGKYSEGLKNSGWKIEPVGTSRLSLWATKDDVRLDLFFIECNKHITKPGTISNCVNLTVSKKKS